MKSYDVSRLPSMIELGYDGENNWRPNSFDCSALLKNHPDGVLSLWLLPQGESQAFPVALERDGNTVIWTPLSEEMTAATGAFQIVCTDGTDVGKSAVVLFRVDESIIPGADHPAAVPSWATQTIERAESAADRAEEAAESIDVEHLEQIIAAAVEAYLNEHPIEAPVQTVNGKTGAVVLGASDVGALPSDTVIPAAVTEQTVAGWGFTKNTGTYSKPSGGIPVSDLADGVIPEPFVIPFTQEEYGDEWVFDSNTLTPLQIFNGIKDAQDKIGVIACVTNRQTGDVVYYPAFNMLAESADPEDDPCVFCAFLDNIGHFVVCDFQVNPYSPDPHSRISVDMVDYDYIKSPSSGSIGDFLCKTSSGEAWASVNIPTKVSELTNDSGFQTAAQVQSAIAAAAELPSVSASDNGKFLRVVNGAWAAQTVPSAEGASF